MQTKDERLNGWMEKMDGLKKKDWFTYGKKNCQWTMLTLLFNTE